MGNMLLKLTVAAATAADRVELSGSRLSDDSSCTVWSVLPLAPDLRLVSVQ